MDKPIGNDQQRKAKWFRYTKYIAVFALLPLGYVGLQALLKKKVDREKFSIATVDVGEIQNMITASGRVVPYYEREINAPVPTEIAQVIKRTGDAVSPKELILRLDQEYTQLEYGKINDELSLRKNNIEKLMLLFDKDLNDLAYRDQIKALQLDEMVAQLNDQKRLFKIGGATAEEVERQELQIKVARLEKKMLENELGYKKSSNKVEKKGLELEYTIQEKRLKELQRKLSETDVRSPIKGVITWINEEIGKTVQQGEPLVKIADLQRYKIEASTSDRYANQLKTGMIAEVKIEKTLLAGIVSRILPQVENNTITFIIELDAPDNPALRSNLRTEISLVTDKKSEVLRTVNGPAFKGGKKQNVFVVRGEKAYKTVIETGLSNANYIEIVQGLMKGDKVIVSDTEVYDHLDEITIIDKPQ